MSYDLRALPELTCVRLLKKHYPKLLHNARARSPDNLCKCESGVCLDQIRHELRS